MALHYHLQEWKLLNFVWNLPDVEIMMKNEVIQKLEISQVLQHSKKDTWIHWKNPVKHQATACNKHGCRPTVYNTVHKLAIVNQIRNKRLSLLKDNGFWFLLQSQFENTKGKGQHSMTPDETSFSSAISLSKYRYVLVLLCNACALV